MSHDTHCVSNRISWSFPFFSLVVAYVLIFVFCFLFFIHLSFFDAQQNPNGKVDDHMESFFPGETLKYLYLLMQPDHEIDLMEYTLNTEAHPLRIFDRQDPPPHSVSEKILR